MCKAMRLCNRCVRWSGKPETGPLDRRGRKRLQANPRRRGSQVWGPGEWTVTQSIASRYRDRGPLSTGQVVQISSLRLFVPFLIREEHPHLDDPAHVCL